MPFEIIRNDITRMRTDAIVNAANRSLLGGGGVDGAIHRAAGPGLLEECRTLGGCETGKAKITGAYRLPCKYVIHTVGPVWQGGGSGEREALVSCYRESLRLALDNGCESVAFPLISSGAYGYPKDEALKAATETIRCFLEDHEMTVYLVIYDSKSFTISQGLYDNIRAYIDDAYIGPDYEETERRRQSLNVSVPMATPKAAPPEKQQAKGKPAGGISFFRRKEKVKEKAEEQAELEKAPAIPFQADAAKRPTEPSGYYGLTQGSLERFLRQMDESFRDMLLRKIDERRMTDAECYKKANIDRKLFNKIKNQEWYKPGKSTVLALAVSLELSLEETKEMLMKAGYSLSHSSKFDLIVEYFIVNGKYDIYEINEALFSFDQKLLGSAG